MPPLPPPRALIHQAGIVGAIASIFSLHTSEFNALQRGGSRALEKVIRSYHYWAQEHGSNGIGPYDHPELGYFRMTPEAARGGRAKELHREHAVPVLVLQSELLKIREQDENRRVTKEAVERVMALNEIVLVSKTEAKQMNERYRTKMPADWTISNSHLARIATLGVNEKDLLGSRLIGPESP